VRRLTWADVCYRRLARHWLAAPSDSLTAVAGDVPRHPPAFGPGVDLDRAQLDTVIDAIGTAVVEADLTVDELDARIGELAGAWACERVFPAFATLWPRWRLALTEAAYRGTVCFGPKRGRNVTYTSVHRQVPVAR
jgi:hypothetical protein